jgi:tRNA A-37 threonylcarbamoyl transferase component Bud32
VVRRDSAAFSASNLLPADRRLSQFGPIDDARFVPGRIFAARYRIVSLLGRGATGEVYRADDLRLGKAVAVKLLRIQGTRSDDLVDRFVSEVRLAREIAHPNVCRVYDIGKSEDWHYLSMEYVDGETLASLLRRIGRMPPEKGLDIARQLCEGLAAAHDVGVLHRDIKPANIMLDGRGCVRLMDFGLAVPVGGSLIGEIAGTAAYMAPEQLAGDRVTERTDLYALGVVLYEVFTGQPLFAARSIDERIRFGYDPVAIGASLQEINPAVDRVIRSCLAGDPAMRPASATAVVEALPGGDQLTAAVAEGRLLAPEVVAAAGEKGRLHPAVAWTMFGAVIVGILVGAAGIGDVTQVRSSLLPKPPEVLAERAREILAMANHDGGRVDHAYWFAANLPASNSSTTPNASIRTFRFVYRQSPLFLIPQNLFRVVRETDPSVNIPGIASVVLDASGRLIRFEALPAETKREPSSAARDWTPLFDAAGLNRREFVDVEPERGLLVPHDREFAWASGERSATPFRVTAAEFGGTAVYFEAGEPASSNNGQGPIAMRSTPLAQAWFFGAFVLAFGVAAILARKNLYRGEGDRQSAWRLSLFVVGGGVLSGLLRAHHVPIAFEEVMSVLSIVGWAMVWGAFNWLVYMGLEPQVRRLWPRTLISWTRLLSGRVRDPLVGRDILIGVLAGVALLVIRVYINDHPIPSDILAAALESLSSPRHFIGILTEAIVTASAYALAGLLFLMLIRVIVRITWVAAAITAVGFVPLLSDGGLEIYSLLLALAGVTIVLRFGLLSWSATLLALFVTTRLPVTLDVNAWYYGSSLSILLLVGGLAAYGCLVAVERAPRAVAEKFVE